MTDSPGPLAAHRNAATIEVRVRLLALSHSLERGAPESRRQLQDLAGMHAEAFEEQAMEWLKRPAAQGPAAASLLAVLTERKPLMELLLDPRFTQPEATALARAACLENPLADVELARALAASAQTRPADEEMRLLEILEAVSTGERILPSLRPFLHHPDAKIRSQALRMLFSAPNAN